jgi:hypothetical protein
VLRMVRVMVVCIVMLGVAAFVAWLGIGIIVSPVGGGPQWLGWAILAVGLIKGAFWLFVMGGFIRRRDAVKLNR